MWHLCSCKMFWWNVMHLVTLTPIACLQDFRKPKPNLPFSIWCHYYNVHLSRFRVGYRVLIESLEPCNYVDIYVTHLKLMNCPCHYVYNWSFQIRKITAEDFFNSFCWCIFIRKLKRKSREFIYRYKHLHIIRNTGYWSFKINIEKFKGLSFFYQMSYRWFIKLQFQLATTFTWFSDLFSVIHRIW